MKLPVIHCSLFLLAFGAPSSPQEETLGPVTTALVESLSPCWGFGGGTRDGVFIRQHFGEALVRVQNVGTAYLVDSENGLLLTAAHVLDQLASNKLEKEIVLGADPYTHFPFTVVDRLPQDVAILQLTDPKAMSKIGPVDIALRSLDSNSTLFVMGYPLYGDQAKPFLRGPSPAKFANLTPEGFIEINHVTSGGNSGGPLFDEFGDVVAISEQDVADGKVGRYLPLVSFKSILQKIPVSDRMKAIEASLIVGNWKADDLRKALRRNDKNPTNLELYVWLQHVSTDAKLRTLIKPLLPCPIAPALEQRGILDVLLSFLTDIPPSDAGKVQLSLAQRDLALGRLSDAALSAKSATAFFAASGESELKARSLLVSAAVDERKGFLSDANKTYQVAFKLFPKPKSTSRSVITDNLMATATQGLGRTSAGLGKTDLATKYFLDAGKTFSLHGNVLGQISAFQGMATVKQQTGDYQLAEDSLAKAITLSDQIDPGVKAALLYQLSTIQSKRGLEFKASKTLSDATILDPSIDSKITPQAWGTNLGSILVVEGLAAYPEGHVVANNNAIDNNKRLQ